MTTWTVNDTDLPQHTPIVVHCKAGGRSAEVLAVLKDPGFADAGFADAGFADAGFADAGFADAVHVGGGIVAWVNEIEPDKPSY